MSEKNQSLEGLRGLACLAVVSAHLLFVFYPYLGNNMRPYANARPKTIIDEWLVYPPFSLGYAADAAVLVFFVLSGYVLTAKFYSNRDFEVLESAAIRRYFRLALPALASVIFAWLLVRLGLMGNQMAGTLNTAGWPIHYYTEKVSLDYALFVGLIGAPFFGVTDLNGPLWTLQIELIGSILLFASYMLFGRRSLVMTVVFFLFFANVLGGRSPAVLNYIAILLGSLLHPLTEWLRRNQSAATAFVILGLIFVSYDNSARFAFFRAIQLPNLLPYGPDFNLDHRIFWHTLGSVLLVAGTIGSSWFASLLAARLPTYLGSISFAMYLIHMPLVMSLGFWAARAGQVMGMGFIARSGFAIVIYFAVLIFLSELFTRYIDTPSIRFAARFAGRISVHGKENLAVASGERQEIVSEIAPVEDGPRAAT